MTYLRTLWDFSRPHTIIGSTLTAISLYLIASNEVQARDISLFLVTYGAAIAVNLYIVGLNQLTDISIDHINKPELPLPSGRMSAQEALQIIVTTGFLAIGLACIGGGWLLFTIGSVFLVGSAYSLPPIRLKRYPLFAALCIVISRGIIGNIGLWLTFVTGLGATAYVPIHLLVFVGFLVGFMTVISLLKDLPDVEGDRAHQIETFSVRFGRDRILWLSVGILIFFYTAMILASMVGVSGLHPGITFFGHLIPMWVLIQKARVCQTDSRPSMTNFYQGIWKLYYLEFGLYLVACLCANGRVPFSG